tara:strand:+ start:7212 stop:8687 length:1476 start_codon:yes stop_codon:yes gene_type:complete
MATRSITLEDIKRLQQERDNADLAYNNALTALDGAIQELREMPHPPPAYDETQISPLNELYDLNSVKPTGKDGWRGKILSGVWWLLAPVLERQHAFNSALVDHINRNVKTHRSIIDSIESSISTVREELEKLIEFQAKLILYAQQITPYIDTKDRDEGAKLRRMHEDVAVGVEGGLSGLSDELQKRWESMVARDQRYETTVNEIRSTTTGWHQVTASLKRELERLTGVSNAQVNTNKTSAANEISPDQLANTYDSYKYVTFEDKFRGSGTEIKTRVASYLPYFKNTSDVLDAGCGRGEFLELLREQGITATGVDLNHEMVEVCRANGLDVDRNDVLSHLTSLQDESLGGLFAAQVVEHLEPAYLLKLIDIAFLKLRPGATLIFETINVASWSAFFQSYVRDITHVRPLHPDTLQYLVTASGFQKAEIVYRSPYPPENKLQPLKEASASFNTSQMSKNNHLAEELNTINENISKLNRLLFTDQDYAVIARRG